MASQPTFEQDKVGTYMRTRSGDLYWVHQGEQAQLTPDQRKQLEPFLKQFEQAKPVAFSANDVVAIVIGPKLTGVRACDGQESDSE
jgi:hypothetical protein